MSLTRLDFVRLGSLLVSGILVLSGLAGPGTAQAEVAADEGSEQPMIIGLAMEDVAHIPGIETLFEVRSASDTARIISGEPYIPGQVVAQFPLEVSDDEVQQLAEQAGASRVIRKSPLGLFEIHCAESETDMQKLMDELWESGKLVEIFPNYTSGGLTFSPDDPHAQNGAQWYLDAPSGIDLDLPDAWEISRGSSSVVVGVMDTGIVMDHPEFAGRLWVNPGEIPGNHLDDDNNGYVDDIHGWDTTSAEGGDPIVEDDDNINGPGGIGHGTWVASILLANADNTHQIAGFDHQAKAMVVRALHQGSGITLSHILGGLDYLILANGRYDVLNMSWIASKFQDGLEVRFNTLEQHGALLVAGAGNGGGFIGSFYPASHPNTITVGATDEADVRWDDPSIMQASNTGPELDFMAPGVNIYTASFSDPTSMSGFHVGPGTSFASPMVAGIASLALAIRPTMTKQDLIDALKASAVDLGAPGRDDEYGWGRVNAYQALNALYSPVFSDGFESGDTTAWTSSLP